MQDYIAGWATDDGEQGTHKMRPVMMSEYVMALEDMLQNVAAMPPTEASQIAWSPDSAFVAQVRKNLNLPARMQHDDRRPTDLGACSDG